MSDMFSVPVLKVGWKCSFRCDFGLSIFVDSLEFCSLVDYRRYQFVNLQAWSVFAEAESAQATESLLTPSERRFLRLHYRRRSEVFYSCELFSSLFFSFLVA